MEVFLVEYAIVFKMYNIVCMLSIQQVDSWKNVFDVKEFFHFEKCSKHENKNSKFFLNLN